jgi:hypothetical protein
VQRPLGPDDTEQVLVAANAVEMMADTLDLEQVARALVAQGGLAIAAPGMEVAMKLPAARPGQSTAERLKAYFTRTAEQIEAMNA